MSGALAFLLFKNLCETTRSTTTVSVPSIIKSWTQTCHTIFCPLIYSGTAARKSRAADCVNVTKSWTAMPFTRSAESHTMRRHANLGLYNSSQLCFHTNSTSHKKGNGNWTLLTKSFSCQTQFVRRLDRGVVMCSLSIPFSLLGVCIMLYLYPNELSSLTQKKTRSLRGPKLQHQQWLFGQGAAWLWKETFGKGASCCCVLSWTVGPSCTTVTLVKYLRLSFLSQWSYWGSKNLLHGVTSRMWRLNSLHSGNKMPARRSTHESVGDFMINSKPKGKKFYTMSHTPVVVSKHCGKSQELGHVLRQYGCKHWLVRLNKRSSFCIVTMSLVSTAWEEKSLPKFAQLHLSVISAAK